MRLVMLPFLAHFGGLQRFKRVNFRKVYLETVVLNLASFRNVTLCYKDKPPCSSFPIVHQNFANQVSIIASGIVYGI